MLSELKRSIVKAEPRRARISRIAGAVRRILLWPLAFYGAGNCRTVGSLSWGHAALTVDGMGSLEHEERERVNDFVTCCADPQRALGSMNPK